MDTDISIIIVSYNTRDFLRNCLQSIINCESHFKNEIIVVDNASRDGSKEMVEQVFPQVKLIANSINLGFAHANNQGIKESGGEYILLLNPDTEVQKGSLDAMVEFMHRNPEVSVIGAKLLNPDRTLQLSCRRFPTLFTLLGEGIFLDFTLIKSGYDEVREVDQPMGACLMARREIFEKAGLLDETYFMFFEDVDWCYRVKQAGGKIYYFPGAEVVHYGSRSIRKFQGKMFFAWHSSRIKFFRKHYKHIPLVGLWVILLSTLPYLTVIVMILFLARIIGYLT